jgi:dipeptidyl aminopeptidase/acylaminoacyl peptidase
MLFDSSKRKNEDKLKRHPRSLLRAASLATLAVILIAVAGILILRPRFTPMSDVPSANLIYADGGEVYEVNFQTGERTPRTPPRIMIDSKETSPDGRWEIRFEWIDKYTTSSLILEDLTGKEPRRTFGTFYGADNTLSWSPDQQWVAFTAYDPTLDTSQGSFPAEIWMVNIPTGDVKRLSHNTYLDSDPFFSPDGTQIAYMSAADGFPRVYVMDVATGESRLLTPDQYGDNPKWSPDGQWIAYEAWYRVEKGTSYTNYTNVYIVRIDGTHVQPISLGKTEYGQLIGWKSKSDKG